MGLRELKATRTRQQIVEVALDLFIEQGYDATTMEQIAERAEVGNTTLYRYFPSKDLLILDPLNESINLGARLRKRPADEPLRVALGAAIHDSLDDVDVDDEDGRVAELRRIIDNAPIPRARLWDLAARSQRDLESAIAERTRRQAGDLQVAITAHITFAMFQIAADTWWAGDRDTPPSAIVDEVLRGLSAPELVIPIPPPT